MSFAVTKYLDIKQLRGEKGRYLAHNSVLNPSYQGVTGQKLKSASHIRSQEQEETNAYTLLTELDFSILLHSRV